MKDGFDFEDELAESIAQIIDEETSSAENLYKGKINRTSDTTELPEEDLDIDEDDDDEDDNERKDNSSRNKLIIIIVAILAFIGIVVGLAVFFIKTALNNSKNNYGYYQNLAYEAKDVDKDYVQAVEYFEKAMKYKDDLLEDETIEVNGVKVESETILVKDLLNLSDCYEELHRVDDKINTLNTVLKYDSYNENAIYYLVKEYDEIEAYENIRNLYESVSKSNNSSLINIFAPYLCSEPIIAPEAGEYGKDQEIAFLNRDGAKIYYTTDGTDPTVNGTLYSVDFVVKEGTTTVKYYMVNEFGFKSDVYTAEYNITYKAPDLPKVSPQSGSYTTSSEQMITIGNIPSGAKAYYEISYNGVPIKPTSSSTVYEAPFAMPEGSVILSVIIINDNGLSSGVVTNNYTLKRVDKFSDSTAEQLIWSTLELHKIIDKNHMTEIEVEVEGEEETGTEKEKAKLTLSYYSKKEIGEQKIWMFNVNIGDEKQEYFYGCDADSGKVYKITFDEENEKYNLKELKY